ncbi:LINE-1 retrotransposable element ORF2 protein [Symbiodinium microadriaticum]|uniref:LINE-1 retrotransposable element ORF2 protein n=1 Tax=Symbiodinium microadriaticum TaxID=2951 RepID=A0A1Q9C286_SYMMI|nr:LINE-1 retrotransposable element ORF2 protein [Symbiodinium microadriaticum]
MRPVGLSFLSWKPWTNLCRALRGAWKHVRESSVYQPGFCWVLLLLLAPLGLYVAALGLFYMLLAELSPKRAKCPRHVAQRLVMQVASSVLCHAIKQCMQLAVQKLTWYHSVQAQEARWQPPSRMVERAPGGDDSPDEFFDALGPSEGDDDGADHPSHQYVQDSSEDLAPELLSSGSSEAIATRVAQAVSNALHLTEGRALALIPSDWQQMRNVTLCMRAMTRGECFHPHTVHVSDDFGALPAAPEGPTVPGPAPARTACPRARMTIEEVDEAIADLELSAMIDTLEEEEATNPAITEETEADLASNEASAGMEAWLKQVGPSGVTEVLPESRAARRDRWSHLSEEALANEMLDMELGALVSSLEEPMDEATLNEVAADMLLNPMPDTAPPASSSASSGSTPAPVLLPLAHAYTRSGILGFLLWLNKDGRSKVNTATLPDHHRDNPIGRQSGSVPFSGQSTEQIEILVAKLGTTEGCYIGPSLARDCGAQPQLPQGGLMDTRNQEVQALAAEAQAGVVERVQELSGRSPGICGPVALEQHIAQQNQAELQAKKAGVIQAPFVPEHGARHRHQDNDLHTFAGSSSNPRILMLSYLQDGSGYGKLFLLWMPDVYNRVSPWNPPLPDCRRHKTIKVLEAVQAENIYAASKRFAPKQARRRLQLRTKEGHLLSHEQEFLRIRDYFTCLYKGPSTPPVMLTHTVCFEETEVQMALGRLAAGKAMPQHSAPAAIWRKCSVQVASRLCQQLNASLVTGSNLLPLNWSISDMALIPKPGKAMTSPEQLRPISLLPMPAKALGAMIAERLHEHASHYLQVFHAVDMERIYRAMRTVLQGLEERHVQVSIDKTVAIVELQGPGAAKCLERYLVSRPNHEGRYFKFVIAGEPRYVKVVPQHTYLGVIIGYKKPEQETAKHRRDLATGAFRRLKKILTCRDVPLKLRLQLWTSLAGWVLQIHLRVFNRTDTAAMEPVCEGPACCG